MIDILKKELIISDMDGTFFLGNTLLEGSLEFAEKLYSFDKKFVFLTNNSSKTPAEYAKKLKRLGVPENLFDVFTSGEATIEFLKSNFQDKRIYLLATESVKEMFINNNIIIDDKNPDVLVMTYDKTLNYEKIEKFAFFLKKDLPYIVSHPDINCPMENDFIPDVGSFMALFEKSTGRTPDFIIGKPNPHIIFMLLKKFNVRKEKSVIIGDRIYTDIQCGINAGIDSILVLSGETTKEMVPEKMEFSVFESLNEIYNLYFK